jgi:hypothetical protein
MRRADRIFEIMKATFIDEKSWPIPMLSPTSSFDVLTRVADKQIAQLPILEENSDH